jgi:hypothetical protein
MIRMAQGKKPIGNEVFEGYENSDVVMPGEKNLDPAAAI